MKQTIILMTLLTLFFFSCDKENSSSEKQVIYRSSPEYGFSIKYPKDYKIIIGTSESVSYFPVNDSKTVITFYKDNISEKTNFNGGGISIAVYKKDAQKPASMEIAGIKLPDVTINNVVFKRTQGTDAAVGNRIQVNTYTAFHHNTWYTITLFINWASIHNFPRDTVKEFDLKKVSGELKKILHTFRFTQGK